MRNAREVLDTAPEPLLTIVEFAALIGQHSQSVRRNIARKKIDVTYWRSNVGVSKAQAIAYVSHWYDGNVGQMLEKVEMQYAGVVARGLIG